MLEREADWKGVGSSLSGKKWSQMQWTKIGTALLPRKVRVGGIHEGTAQGEVLVELGGHIVFSSASKTGKEVHRRQSDEGGALGGRTRSTRALQRKL